MLFKIDSLTVLDFKVCFFLVVHILFTFNFLCPHQPCSSISISWSVIICWLEDDSNSARILFTWPSYVSDFLFHDLYVGSMALNCLHSVLDFPLGSQVWCGRAAWKWFPLTWSTIFNWSRQATDCSLFSIVLDCWLARIFLVTYSVLITVDIDHTPCIVKAETWPF